MSQVFARFLITFGCVLTMPVFAQSPFAPGQEWVGRYRCLQGDTPLTVQIMEVSKESGGTTDGAYRIRGVFGFGRGRQNGGYYVLGRYSPQTGKAAFVPSGWIQRPPGYVAVGMTGSVEANGTAFSGRIDSPVCGDFTLARKGANAPARSASNAASVSTQQTDSPPPSRRVASFGTQLGEGTAAVLDRLPAARPDPDDLAAPCVPSTWTFAEHDAEYVWQKYAGMQFGRSNTLFYWAKAHLPSERFDKQGAGLRDRGCLDGKFVARTWQATHGLPVTGVLTQKDVEPLVEAIAAANEPTKREGRLVSEGSTGSEQVPDIRQLTESEKARYLDRVRSIDRGSWEKLPKKTRCGHLANLLLHARQMKEQGEKTLVTSRQRLNEDRRVSEEDLRRITEMVTAYQTLGPESTAANERELDKVQPPAREYGLLMLTAQAKVLGGSGAVAAAEDGLSLQKCQ